MPYALNERLDALLEAQPKEPVILCYGRPSVSRNCFGVIVEGIRLWQERQPDLSSTYKIVFAGEEFEPRLVGELENAEVKGKMSLEDYADLLSRASVGVSLMVSPHPSYPPLEMASAGCITITNSYEGKDLTTRSDAVRSIAALDPRSLADALELAISDTKLGESLPRQKVRPGQTRVDAIDYDAIVQAAWS